MIIVVRQVRRSEKQHQGVEMPEWVSLPTNTGQGAHLVCVPPEFNKTLGDYESPEKYLEAIRLRWEKLDERGYRMPAGEQ